MSGYQIAIPTYNRPDRVAALLNRLADKEVDPGWVTLFVDEGDPATQAYIDLRYDYFCNVVVSQVRGVADQRKVISAHYPAGTPVLSMDDDVYQVIHRRPEPLNRKQLPEWDSLFTRMFEETAERGLNVWGVKPTTNISAASMGRRTEGLRFAIGTLYGYFSRPGHPIHDTAVAVKEDYELSIRAYLYDGGLLRFEDVGVDADHYSLPGGCVDWRTSATSLDAAMTLLDTYPDLVKWNQRRFDATGHAEISLVRKDRTRGEYGVL